MLCLGHWGPGPSGSPLVFLASTFCPFSPAFGNSEVLQPHCPQRPPMATEHRPCPTADTPNSQPVQGLPVWNVCPYETRPGCEYRERIRLVSHLGLENKTREMSFSVPFTPAQGGEGHPQQALPPLPIQAVANRFKTRNIKIRSPEQRPFTVRLDKDSRRTYRDVIG